MNSGVGPEGWGPAPWLERAGAGIGILRGSFLLALVCLVSGEPAIAAPLGGPSWLLAPRSDPADRTTGWTRLVVGAIEIQAPGHLEYSMRRTAQLAPEMVDRLGERFGVRPPQPLYIILEEQAPVGSPVLHGPSRHARDRVSVWLAADEAAPEQPTDEPLRRELARALAAALARLALEGESAGLAGGEVALLATPEGGTTPPFVSAGVRIEGMRSNHPLWLWSGGVDYWAAGLGARTWGVNSELVLRSLALEFPADTRWPGELPERQVEARHWQVIGNSFARYLAQRFGRDILSVMLGVAPCTGSAAGLEDSDQADWRLAQATRSAPAELWQDWWREVRRRYANQVAARGTLQQGSDLELPFTLPPGGFRRLRLAPQGHRLGLSTPQTLFLMEMQEAQAAGGRRSESVSATGPLIIEEVTDGFSFSPTAEQLVVASRGCPGGPRHCLRTGRGITPELFLVRLGQDRHGVLRIEQVRQLTAGLAASEPSWSPDGGQVAFVQRFDGGSRLGLLDLTDPAAPLRWLLYRSDGSLLQELHWTRSGQQLLFTLRREGRQELWSLGRSGTGLRPHTWTGEEVREPVVGPQGEICYSASVEGFFDIFCEGPSAGQWQRRTRLATGGFSPAITRQGSLLFLRYTATGLVPALLPPSTSGELVSRPFPDDPDLQLGISHYLAFPTLPPAPLAPPQPMQFRHDLLPPRLGPALVLDGRSVSAGLIGRFDTLSGRQQLEGRLLLGTTSLVALRGRHALTDRLEGFVEGSLRQERSVLQGAEGSTGHPAEGTPEQRAPRQAWSAFARAGLAWQVGAQLELRLGGLYRWSEAEQSDGSASSRETLAPFWSITYQLSPPELRSHDLQLLLDRLVGPTPRLVQLEHRWRLGTIPEQYDGGELLGQLSRGSTRFAERSHLLAAEYQETWALPGPSGLQHALLLGLEAGWQSANVPPEEEFQAGGTHPWRWWSREQPITGFPGYAPGSLHGETLLLGRLGYRIALARGLGWRWRGWQLESCWLRSGITLGNLWGYTAEPSRTAAGEVLRFPESPDLPPALRGHVRTEPGSVRREQPFRDRAAAHGQPWLGDAWFELILGGGWRGAPWLFRLELAWGFQELTRPAEPAGPFLDTMDSRSGLETVRPAPRLLLLIGNSG